MDLAARPGVEEEDQVDPARIGPAAGLVVTDPGGPVVAEADAAGGLCNRRCGDFYSPACCCYSKKAPNTAIA